MRDQRLIPHQKRCALVAAFFVAILLLLAPFDAGAEENAAIFSPVPAPKAPIEKNLPDKDNPSDVVEAHAVQAKNRQPQTPAHRSARIADPANTDPDDGPPAETVPLETHAQNPRANIPAHTVKEDHAEPVPTVASTNKSNAPQVQIVGPYQTLPRETVTPKAVPAQSVAPAVDAPEKPSDSIASKGAEPVRRLRSFKELIELPDDQFDIAEAVLVVGAEKGFAPSADAGETLARLDAMAEAGKKLLPAKPDVTDYYDALYEVVLNRRPADPAHEENAEDFDLTRSVLQRRGNCLGMGIAALAVARRMGAPITGTQCPGHFFLRGVDPSKPKIKGKDVSIYFDATHPTPDNWNKLDDDFYRHWRHFDIKSETSGEYLRPMSDKQVLSAFLASRSGYLAREGRIDDARDDAERALALNPKNVAALINSGFVQESAKNFDEADALYKRVLEIDPQCVRALNNLAYVKIRDKHDTATYDPKKAEKLIDQALKLDPDEAYLFATKGEICAVRGDYQAATHNLQYAARLAPKNAAYRERFLALREHLKREFGDEPPPTDVNGGGIPHRDKNGSNVVKEK